MQPMDSLRKDNPNYKYVDLKFDRKQADKILAGLDGKDFFVTLKKRLAYLFESEGLISL